MFLQKDIVGSMLSAFARRAGETKRGDLDEPSIAWKFAQVFCRIFTTCCFDLKVFGRNNVPHEGGVLLVSNHQSYLDPVLVGVRLDRPLNYIAKSELFENRHFAKLLRWLHSFPVHQGRADVGAVRETIVRLRAGRALAIFPEGSRTNNGELLPIERGVSLIVRRAKVPVVPVVIEGSYRAWPITESIFRPTNIRLVYGPPMDLSGLSEEEILRKIEKTLREMLGKMRQANGANHRNGGQGVEITNHWALNRNSHTQCPKFAQIN
jgi:1-acyl-sn-glycerol-3-phosphate acyltransferase